jgi:hypothetical protein
VKGYQEFEALATKVASIVDHNPMLKQFNIAGMVKAGLFPDLRRESRDGQDGSEYSQKDRTKAFGLSAVQSPKGLYSGAKGALISM